MDKIETVTQNHYNQDAKAFWNGTKNHDAAQNHQEFLAPFPKKPDILNLGCGAKASSTPKHSVFGVGKYAPKPANEVDIALQIEAAKD